VVMGESDSTASSMAQYTEYNEAFRWEGGVLTGLGSRLGGDDFVSHAYAASADGSVIVGGNRYALRWDNSVLSKIYNNPAFSDGSAEDISADGSVIVGKISDYNLLYSPRFAARWEAGVMQRRDIVPGSLNTRATAVSADGSVTVGWGDLRTDTISDWTLDYPPSSHQAFRWEGESFIRLDFDEATDVSADGSVIIGMYWIDPTVPGGVREGVRWEDGTLTTLGQFPGTGTPRLHPLAVSADGSVIVGSANSGSKAFIWDDANGVRYLKVVLENNFNLDLAGWGSMVAKDISADGSVIVGYGNNPEGNNEAWMAILDWPAGDFTLDNDVDGIDFLEWQRGFGGAYDANDLAEWENSLGTVAGSLTSIAGADLAAGSASAAIPEPNTLLLVALATTGLLLRRRA
jgi:uncharacterized membrane protein